MKKLKFIIISERQADVEFFSQVAQNCGAEVQVVKSCPELSEALASSKDSMVFWDVDHEGATSLKHPLARAYVSVALANGTSSSRVYAVSDKSLFQDTEFMTQHGKIFCSNFCRRYGADTAAIYTKMLNLALAPNESPFATFFEASKIQKVVLKKSSHKKAAVEAVQTVLTKAGLDQAMASKVAQGTDELLMNAIFDAPINSSGTLFRHTMDRKLQFDFNSGEEVILEVAFNEQFIGVCVSDFYGAINKDLVFKFLGQDYRSKTYQIPLTQGAGLGLYGMVNSSLSLGIFHKPKTFTKVLMLLPNTSSVRQFKQSFQFVSFLSQS